MSERIVCNDPGVETLREEIVRCKDCLYFSEDELGAFCSWFDFEDTDEERQRNGFCSWGEAKTKEVQR